MKKFMSKFQVITFPEFTEEELNRIVICLAKFSNSKDNKKILEGLIKFHNKDVSS